MGTISPLVQDLLAFFITLFSCLIWIGSVENLVNVNILEQKLSRKVIHVGTGPIFLLTWNLFSHEFSARYFAAVVPLLITLNFALIGLGIVHDPKAVASLTRRNDRKEILRGPLFYGISFIIITLFFWRNSPVGIMSLMMLCGGDGFAEIIGRRYGKRKLFGSNKTWIGSLAMFIASFVFSMFFLIWFDHSGNFSPRLDLTSTTVLTLTVSFFVTIVEALSFESVDNLSIPFMAIVCGCTFKTYYF